MEITYTVSPTYTLPNITVEEKRADGVLKAHRLTVHDGYIMYDSNANDTEIDPETMEEVPVTYYYRQATVNIRVPFENWGWVAVPRSEVDENYIFGGSDEPNHEVM